VMRGTPTKNKIQPVDFLELLWFLKYQKYTNLSHQNSNLTIK
jgi:hypothetical protein